MVKTDSGEAKKSPVTARLFLTSIKKWYPKGIPVCISSVSKPREADNGKDVSVALNLDITEDMEHCFARVIDDKGNVVQIEDEFGEEKDKIEEISNPDEVAVWVKMRIEDPENDEFKVFNLGSAFPVINYAFAEAGDVPHNNKKNLIFTYDELVEVLEGLEFRAKTETRKYKGGKPYQVLIPESL